MHLHEFENMNDYTIKVVKVYTDEVKKCYSFVFCHLIIRKRNNTVVREEDNEMKIKSLLNNSLRQV